VEEYSPPPNPAKITDSRARTYIAEYGAHSWELDALDPDVLGALVRDTVVELRDEALWDAALEEEHHHGVTIDLISQNWTEVETLMEQYRNPFHDEDEEE
jgi:hypothetical protein